MRAWADWFAQRPRLVLACRVLLILVVLVHLGISVRRIVVHGPGDLGVNREFGRRFLAREDLYAGGCCYTYMPIAALHWSPMAWGSPLVVLIVRYAVGLAALWLVLRLLARMVRPALPADRWRGGFIAGLTLVLGAQYLLRDLDDGGPHLVYLALLVAGVWLAQAGRPKLAGLSIGLATALKVTPGLLLAYFAWKRQWQLLAWSTIAVLCWVVLPAIWLGPSAWWQSQRQWNRVAAGVFTGRNDAQRDDNELRVQNQNLRLAALRYLTAYPSGHPLRPAHPGYLDVGRLDPSRARHVAVVVVALLLAACGWRWRGRLGPAGDPRWAVETSGVLLLVVLLSPVTWLQHLVFVVPALYVLLSEEVSGGGLGRGGRAAMYLYAVAVLMLNREVLGRGNSLLLLSYHLHTLATLLLLALIWIKRPLLVRNRLRVVGLSTS